MFSSEVYAQKVLNLKLRVTPVEYVCQQALFFRVYLATQTFVLTAISLVLKKFA